MHSNNNNTAQSIVGLLNVETVSTASLHGGPNKGPTKFSRQRSQRDSVSGGPALRLTAKFLVGGGRNPPFDPLSLIKAGDVEQNPGPATPSANKAGDVAQSSGPATPPDNNAGEVAQNTGPATPPTTKVGDVAQNTGPATPPASNPAIRVIAGDRGHSSSQTNTSQHFPKDQTCNKCGRKGRLDTNPFICSAPGCTERCHRIKTCSGISRYSASKNWLCSLHSPGTSGCPQPQVVLAAGTCHTCDRGIRSGVDRFKCAEGACKEECHKGEKCSNFNRQYWKNAAWRCSTHSTLAQTRSSTPPPIPDRPKSKCQACRRPVKCNTTPAVCSSCSLHFHASCLPKAISRPAREEIVAGLVAWKCDKCKQKDKDPNYIQMVGGTKIETSAQDLRKFSKSSLRILQWNADGINTKLSELELRLFEDDYDICVVQESKLRGHQETPRIKNYTTIRTDRPVPTGGGGLLTFIKSSLIFERVQESSQNGTEASSLRVKMGKRQWATICNVYCPPVRSHSRTASLDTACFPHTEESIIMGDFNAHNTLWDPFQPEDDRGERLLDWTLDHDLRIMNDGSPTRLNTKARHQTTSSDVSQCPVSDSRVPSQGGSSMGRSAPDVTICGGTWRDKCSWCIVDPIGSSDHTPISVTLDTKVTHGSVFKGRAAWRTSNVDWKSFQDEVESSIPQMPNTNIHAMSTEFHKALISAGHKHVGTVKPGSRSKRWITPAVREARKERNRLRHRLPTHRAEWVEACKKAQELQQQARTDAWREILDDATNAQDDSKLWKVIKSLNGSPENNSPNEAMSFGGRLITSNKRKADIFVNHYAKVSGSQMSKSDRDLNRDTKKRLRAIGNGAPGTSQPRPTKIGRNPDQIRSGPVKEGGEELNHSRPSNPVVPSNRDQETDFPEFTLNELKGAISKIKSRGAPGPDNIPPMFLKNLGPKALERLLLIFNECLRSGDVPQPWKNATIIPILKRGKPTSALASYRPISLTSCVVKLLERMFSERLYFLAERGNWFSRLQAGFRKGRGVEDQILRMTQRISDGINAYERSILVLLDFSKAYDTVWRQRLLQTLQDQGVPNQFVLFLSNFLQNRQAKVRFNGALSKSRKMSQGLPQGSVLAPILFLFYINNLASLLPADLTISMYADDVSILSSDKNRAIAQSKAQEAVDIVVSWSKEWKLNLNGSKSEVSFFSNKKEDLGWTPTISIGGQDVRFEPTPRLLGVTLDRNMSFGTHVDLTVSKVAKKCRFYE